MRKYNPYRHDGLDRLFNGHLRWKDFLFRKEEEKPLRGDEGCWNKNSGLPLVVEIGQLIRHKAEHVISLPRKFNKDSLPEGTLTGCREGIGQLFWRKVEIL